MSQATHATHAPTGPADGDPPVLAVHGLCKRFRKRTAVDNLSLSVHKGDIYGFLGPNGAGKTTTLRMIVGLIAPTAGTVRIAGNTLSFWNRSPLSKIGASIDAPAFYTYLSGRDNLRLLADLTGPCSPRRIDEVLDRVGMLARADDKVRVYSHGMKQRLAIAAALLPKPELVLLDEPTNGLDPMGIRDVRELIRSLANDDGYTIFLSSHLLVEVEQICNRGAIMVEGKKLWEGQVAELLGTQRRIRLRATPAEGVRAVLTELGAGIVPAVAIHERGQPSSAPGEGPGPISPVSPISSESEDDLYHVAAPELEPDELVARLVGAGCRVREVMVESPSLEEVFLELVHRKESL